MFVQIVVHTLCGPTTERERRAPGWYAEIILRLLEQISNLSQRGFVPGPECAIETPLERLS